MEVKFRKYGTNPRKKDLNSNKFKFNSNVKSSHVVYFIIYIPTWQLKIVKLHYYVAYFICWKWNISDISKGCHNALSLKDYSERYSLFIASTKDRAKTERRSKTNMVLEFFRRVFLSGVISPTEFYILLIYMYL